MRKDEKTVTLVLTVDEAELLLNAWGYTSAVGLAHKGELPKEVAVNMGAMTIDKWLRSGKAASSLSEKCSAAIYEVADAQGIGDKLRAFGKGFDEAVDEAVEGLN